LKNILFLFNKKDGKNFKNCLNQSMRIHSKYERPLQKLFEWWQQEGLDLDSSVCILNYAVEHNL
jgi:hypothetical protein